MFIGGVVLLVLTQAWRIPVALNARWRRHAGDLSVVGTALAFHALFAGRERRRRRARKSARLHRGRSSAALCARSGCTRASVAGPSRLCCHLVMAVLIALPERASEKSTEKGGELKKEGAENREAAVSRLSFSHYVQGSKQQHQHPASPRSRRGWRSPRPARPAARSAPYSAAATTVCVTTGMANSTTYTLRTRPPMPSSAQRAAPSAVR